MDMTADFKLSLASQRSLDLSGSLNWGKNEITHVDGLPAELATSTQETGLLDEVSRVAIEKERPDWRGTLSAEYAQGHARGLARVSYYGKFSSAQPAFRMGSANALRLARRSKAEPW